MSTALAQLRLLLWKSAKTSARSPKWTLIEIVLPLLAVACIVMDLGKSTKIERIEVPIRLRVPVAMPPKMYIAYRCGKEDYDNITHALTEFCINATKCQFGAYSDSYLTIHSMEQTSLDLSFTTDSPVTLRDATSSSEFEFGVSFENLNFDAYDAFLFIGSFITEKANSSTPLHYTYLPTPRDWKGSYSKIIDNPSMIIALSLISLLAAVNLVREICDERASAMKDYLLVMGLGRGVYYVHHVIWSLVKALPVIVTLACIVGRDEPSLGINFFFVTLLYIGAQLSLASIIPALIKKPSMASIFAFVLIPFNTVIARATAAPRSMILRCILTAINPGHALAYAHDALREQALRMGDVPWFGEYTQVFKLGGALFMMIVDMALFLSIAILIDCAGSSFENVLATVLNLSSRCRKSVARMVREPDSDENEMSIHEVDAGLASVPVDIELVDVHKTYPSGEQAVKGISMKLYRGQVTVLLGHNGAGKSTTFGMIAGITVPTAGKIKYGLSADERGGGDPRTIGYCPQYNPIFSKLSVIDHLEFFAALKGSSKRNQWEDEAIQLMELLKLTDKMLEHSSSLSDGMKRKLCIAMAMIGGSRVVLLDEPTAGVDTAARRDIERLLVSQKKERTFLLTTHYTDEAENLGDRILIMSGGKLVCSGSSHFLNKEFGAGYVLSCVVSNSADLAQSAQRTLRLCEETVKKVKPERAHGQQFEIWLDRARSESFPVLFSALEQRSRELGVESYGLSNNTLEQVFLRVGEMTGVSQQAKVGEALETLIKQNGNRSMSRMRSFFYLQYKRFVYETAELHGLLFNMLPILATVFSIIVTSGLIPDAGPDKADESFDMLRFDRCYRVGVEQSLHLYDALRTNQRADSCVMLEEVANASEWYHTTAMTQRPPILATIGRSMEESEAVDVKLTRVLNQVQLNTMAMHFWITRALSNATFNITAKFVTQPPPLDSPVNQEDDEPHWPVDAPKQPQNREEAMMIYMLLQPLLAYRSVGFYVVERTLKFSHQQYLTGLPKWLYWTAAFCSDVVLFAMNFSLSITLCLLFGVFRECAVKLIASCCVIYTINQLKFYILQRFFASKAKGENLSVIVVVFNIILCFVAHASKRDITYLYYDPHTIVYAALGEQEEVPMVQLLLTHLVLVALVFFAFEYEHLRLKIMKHINAFRNSTLNAAGTRLIEAGDPDNLVLDVRNVMKSYGKTMAVRGVSFGVKHHECFGLLGVNGAGKTSTFEVLTGASRACMGTATVAGVDCATPAKIGYCPQFDAMMLALSGRQNLRILAALHGYRRPALVANTVLDCVGMREQANKKCKSYSGGQRRKISVAAALLAQNSLIILDEPTAGIDPVTRRDIWSVICALRDSTKTAVVLTSHSMDEVEALCSRIAVMRAGKIAAAGTSQHLKSTYGSHFKLTLIVEGARAAEVDRAVGARFPDARRVESASERVHYFAIPRFPGILWSAMFSKAIAVAKRLGAVDYCLTQASLEDAFIALTSGTEDDFAKMTRKAKITTTESDRDSSEALLDDF